MERQRRQRSEDWARECSDNGSQQQDRATCDPVGSPSRRSIATIPDYIRHVQHVRRQARRLDCSHHGEVMKKFQFSKHRNSETLIMILQTNNTEYDFRYINILNLLQPYIYTYIYSGCHRNGNSQIVPFLIFSEIPSVKNSQNA